MLKRDIGRFGMISVNNLQVDLQIHAVIGQEFVVNGMSSISNLYEKGKKQNGKLSANKIEEEGITLLDVRAQSVLQQSRLQIWYRERSMEQNQENRNRPPKIWLIDFLAEV